MPTTPGRVRTCPHHFDSLVSHCLAQGRRTSPEEGEGPEDIRSFLHLRLYLDRCIRRSAFHFWVNVLSGIRRISRCRLIFHTRAPFDSAFGRDLHQNSDSTTTRRVGFSWRTFIARDVLRELVEVHQLCSQFSVHQPPRVSLFTWCWSQLFWRSLDDTPAECNPTVTSHRARACSRSPSAMCSLARNAASFHHAPDCGTAMVAVSWRGLDSHRDLGTCGCSRRVVLCFEPVLPRSLCLHVCCCRKTLSRGVVRYCHRGLRAARQLEQTWPEPDCSVLNCSKSFLLHLLHSSWP